MEKLTESKIQRIVLEQFFAPNSIKYKAENLFIYGWESDVWIMTKSGLCYEFEIKISRGDFFNDFKNKAKKHSFLGARNRKYLNGIPNYFYYVVPKDLISIEEVPDYAGLIYIDCGIVIIKKAPKLNSKKASSEDLNLADKFYWKYRHWKDKTTDNQILLEEYRSGERHDQIIKDLKETIKQDKDHIKSIEKLYGETYAIDKWIIRSLRKLLDDNQIQYDFRKIEDDAIEKIYKCYGKD